MNESSTANESTATLSEEVPPEAAVPGETSAESTAPSRAFNSDYIRKYGVYAAILVIIVINLFITDNYFTVDNLWTQLQQVAPIVIVALGMALVIGTGGINLSVGSIMAISAAVMPLYLGYGTIPAILFGIVIGTAAGALAGVLIAKANLQPIVATLGIMVAARGLAGVISGQVSFSDPGLKELGTGRPFLNMPYIILVAIVVVVIMGFVVRKTVFGRQVLAVGGNLRASELAGLPVTRTIIMVYLICGLLAAIAGILVATRGQGVDPTRLGLLMELSAITAVVIGGAPLSGGKVKVVGTVAGALLVQLFTSTLIVHNIPDSVSQMALAVIVILAVYVQQIGKRTK